MQNRCEFSARISCEKPSNRKERIGSVMDRSRQAESILGIATACFGVINDDGCDTMTDNCSETLFELFVVGVIRGGFHMMAIS